MKCEIQWIDCSAQPTPHDNQAVGYAIWNGDKGIRRSFLICAEHKATMDARKSHHDEGCSHYSYCQPWPWSFMSFTEDMANVHGM